MDNTEKGVVAFTLFCFVIALAAVAGWILNFIALVHLVHASAPTSAMFVARLVGVIVPVLGAVLGWF